MKKRIVICDECNNVREDFGVSFPLKMIKPTLEREGWKIGKKDICPGCVAHQVQ